MSVRLTPKRKKILNVLQTHDGLLSAKDLHGLLPDIDLATIYRTLELFLEEKIIKKVSVATGEVLYEHQAEPHHHAVCTDCKRVIHFTAPDEKIKKLLGLDNFEINELEVIVEGTCRTPRCA